MTFSTVVLSGRNPCQKPRGSPDLCLFLAFSRLSCLLQFTIPFLSTSRVPVPGIYGESHGQRSLVSHSPWGRKESHTTERLHFSLQAQKLACVLRCQGRCRPVNVSSPANPNFALNDSESLTEAEQTSERPLRRGNTQKPSHTWPVSPPQHLAPWGPFNI